MDKELLGFDYTDVINHRDFSRNFLKCAHLSGKRESSMAVNSNWFEGGFYINKPLEEFKYSCGESNNLHVKNQGLYVGDEDCRIMRIHFHPTNSLAIPSAGDLFKIEGLLPEKHPTENFNVSFIDVVGYNNRDKNLIDVMSYQVQPECLLEGFLTNVILRYEDFLEEIGKAKLLKDKHDSMKRINDFLNENGFNSKYSSFHGSEFKDVKKDLFNFELSYLTEDPYDFSDEYLGYLNSQKFLDDVCKDLIDDELDDLYY
ncbi:hypothetical protein KY334_03235 [Candidatus Woesearchaeota archaeon]|nr:hypothetical protein [Candidatus Woesearchaeota archaeon]